MLAILAGAQPSDAAPVSYFATLTGPGESPPNASPGTGFAEVDFDGIANTLHVHVAFSGLLGTTTASHIHAPTLSPGTGTAGVATTTPTFAGFPLGVTSGTYDTTLDLTLASSYNPAFVTANGGTTAGAETALAKIEKTVSHFLPGQPIHCQQYHVLFSPAERRRTVVAGYGAPAFL